MNKQNKKRILIAEDEAITAMRIRGILEKNGYTVTSTEASGAGAVESAFRDNPDLLIMDIVLAGDVDGIEAAGKIREKINVPVVYLTAYSDDEIIERAKKTEPAGYIVKPFDESDLHVTVELAFYKHTMEQQLKESTKRFRDLVETTSDWIWETDEQGHYTYVSPKIHDLLGYRVEEVLGKTPFDFMPPDEAARVMEIFTSIMNSRKPFNEFENINIHKNGHRVIMETNGIPVFDDNGVFRGYRGIDRDVTERKRIEAEERDKMLVATLNADIGNVLAGRNTLGEMLQECTEVMVKHLDVLFARIWLYSEEENVLKLSASAGLYTSLDGPHSRKQLGKSKIGIIARDLSPILTNRVIGDPHITDQEWAKRENITAFAGHPLSLGNRLIGVMALFSRKRFTDIIAKSLASIAGLISLGIERKKMEDRLHEAAITDPLTGLFNRRGFFALAGQQCKLSVRNKKAMSLLYMDLDGMKRINDALGHKEGDQALMDTAKILRQSFRKSDILARIGGDEFAVLLTDTSQPDIENVVIRHVRQKLADHNRSAQKDYDLVLSIGMARFNPGRPCSIDELLHRGDKAMYEDKRRHKGEG